MRSVDRAVSILQILARDGEARVTELADAVGIHKSTAFRLIATLEARGLVEQDGERGRYRLAHGVVQLAGGATRTQDLSVLSRPVCEQLADEVGETVNVAIRQGASVVSVDQVIGTSAVTTINWVGQRTPLHATSGGKVFLAHLSARDADALLEEPLGRFTEHTITDAARLREQLVAVRQDGYALAAEEHEVGLNAIAAPIRSFDGDVVAVLTVSGPSFRVTEERWPELARSAVRAAESISARNGYPKYD